jgi:hypothetical protein
MAAERGFIQHVVVNERGGVDHLDGGGEGVMGRRDGAARLRGEQQKRRAKPLAAVMPQMLN